MRRSKEGSQVSETSEYAQERYRERVAQGLILARLERAREAGQRPPDARRAGRVRRALARMLVALALVLAAPEQRDQVSA
jgi:hypothetical protein